MASRRPQLWLVREKFEPGEPYAATVFGVFNNRKYATICKKAVTGGQQPVCAQVELVPLDLNYRYDLGTAAAKTDTED
jgi:hypothetical protein